MNPRELLFRCFCVAMAFCALSSPAQIRISEFMASNTRTLADVDNSFEDWIEIQNTSTTNVNLLNWALTDDDDDLGRWRFPATNLPPGGYMVVFASDKNRRTPGNHLHTNFRLGAGGEFLALVNPAGQIVSQFDPFPPQFANVSFGIGMRTESVPLLSVGAAARAFVPSELNGGNKLHHAWTGTETNEPFNDSGWISGQTGVGMSSGGDGINPADIVLNLETLLLNSNASAFVRIPFVCADPQSFRC